jgi:hypothetical protein
MVQKMSFQFIISGLKIFCVNKNASLLYFEIRQKFRIEI